MIQALTGAISAATSLVWLGLIICLLIYLRKPITNLMENVSNAGRGKIELGPQRVSVEWERSIVTAAVNLTAAAFEKKQGEQELPRIVNSMVASVAATANGLPVAGKNLLWVDDQPENNAYGIKALEATGINVFTTRSTQEALDQIKMHDFAVIVTDQLRVEDGTEDHEAGTHLLEAVRKMKRQIPVILSTAFPNKLESKQRGFFDATNTQHGVYELVMQAITERSTATRI
jgi:CheY-like chemotaxis protein